MPERPSFQAPPGTRDVFPPESARWEALIATFARITHRYGYHLVHGPLFEDVAVFERLGAGTDVVRKEMYSFEDQGGRHLALRPEATASVVRAYVQHRPPTPWKVWCVTPAFRQERQQAGRYRQHHQLDVEVIGVADPDVDVEVLALGHDYLSSLGLRDYRLTINTMGTPADRVAYAARLREWLGDRLADLAPADREKVDSHPLRVLDSKAPATQAVVAGAPPMIETLDNASVAHFERVKEGLAAIGIPYEVESTLVRGLDYYTHTLFEFRSGALESAQNTILGGGRYDGLVEQMGGPPTPGIGFGSGIERVLLACDAEGVFALDPPAVAAYVVDVVDGSHARAITHELRAAGISADRAFGGRSMKAQMKRADASGARVALIVGDEEADAGTVTIRDLRGGGGQDVVARGDAVDHVRKRLEEP